MRCATCKGSGVRHPGAFRPLACSDCGGTGERDVCAAERCEIVALPSQEWCSGHRPCFGCHGEREFPQTWRAGYCPDCVQKMVDADEAEARSLNETNQNRYPDPDSDSRFERYDALSDQAERESGEPWK